MVSAKRHAQKDIKRY